MFEDLSDREKYGLAGVFAVSIIAAFGTGSVLGSPTGAFAGDASEAEIRSQVQSLISQQEEQQQSQLASVANQSEDLSREDLSINTEVESVSRSEFGSLYRVTISTTGEVPNRLGNSTRSIDESQEMYISSDGRYLFSAPTDLEQQQQSTSPAQGQ